MGFRLRDLGFGVLDLIPLVNFPGFDAFWFCEARLGFSFGFGFRVDVLSLLISWLGFVETYLLDY